MSNLQIPDPQNYEREMIIVLSDFGDYLLCNNRYPEADRIDIQNT